MDLRILNRTETAHLEPLLARYPYHDYRNYRAIPRQAQVQILLRELEEGEGRLVALEEHGVIAGLATYVPLPWDSRVFEVPMAKIGRLIVDPHKKPLVPLLNTLLHGLMTLARDEGVKHLSLRIDCDDIEAIRSLEDEGFRLTDCLVTYLCRRKDANALPPVKIPFTIREYRPEDRESILAIVRERYAQYPGRYAVDPSLPREASLRFYLAWAENVCSGKMADRIIVAERAGKLVGFLSFQINPIAFKSTGIRIAGRGLSAVLPEGVGSFVGLVWSAAEATQEIADLVEYDSQLGNFPALRIYQKFGFQPVRAKYAFHKSLSWKGDG